MSEFNTFEFVVDERPEGVRKLKKILGRITVIAVPIIVACVLILVKLFALAIIPLLLLGVILYFWKLFNVELEYSMTSGIMTFSRINGGLKRKKVLEFTIREAKEIAPPHPRIGCQAGRPRRGQGLYVRLSLHRSRPVLRPGGRRGQDLRRLL